MTAEEAAREALRTYVAVGTNGVDIIAAAMKRYANERVEIAAKLTEGKYFSYSDLANRIRAMKEPT